jgi:hypothetical protein
VVMPGSIKAGELAHRARKIFPRIAVLFTSGYTAIAATQNRELDAGAPLLSKPYRRDDLARKVRAVLAEAKGRISLDTGIHPLPPEARPSVSPGPDPGLAGLG